MRNIYPVLSRAAAGLNLNVTHTHPFSLSPFAALMQPPHQFKTFKFETPEAEEGRKLVKDLGGDVKTHEKKIKV